MYEHVDSLTWNIPHIVMFLLLSPCVPLWASCKTPDFEAVPVAERTLEATCQEARVRVGRAVQAASFLDHAAARHGLRAIRA